MSFGPICEFATKEEAFEWMYFQVDDLCVDNERFAFEDDLNAVSKYDEQAADGCCGSFNETVLVAGRKAFIGCNYGH